MMSREEHELRLAGFFDEDSDYGGAIGKAVMELFETFKKQGHSGASAPRVAAIFKLLVSGQPLMPLTGEDDEWGDSLSGQEDTKQNKRVGGVFKKGEKAYYLDAVVWKGEESWDTFTGVVDGIMSRQFIKEFPFVPKTFYVDVVREYNPDNDDASDYVCHVKDPKQLEEVWKYYDKCTAEEFKKL